MQSKTLHSIFKMHYFKMQTTHSVLVHSIFRMQYFRMQI